MEYGDKRHIQRFVRKHRLGCSGEIIGNLPLDFAGCLVTIIKERPMTDDEFSCEKEKTERYAKRYIKRKNNEKKDNDMY